MSVRAIGRIEAGQVAAPRWRTVRLLADAFGLDAAGRERFRDAASEAGHGRPGGEIGELLVAPRLLPAPVPHLVGRGTELRSLDAVAASGLEVATVVAVTGMAGVGKTSLAVHWAHRVAGGFPDGQLFVDLRGYDVGRPVRAIDALGELLRAAGVPSREVPVNQGEAVGMYRRLLQGRRVLVILDNARDASQVRPLLPGSAGCLALVTSRDRLTGLVALQHATRIELEVLTADASVELLTPLLGAARRGADVAGAAGRLAAACGNLPLALRIAGAMLADRPGRDVDAYIAELHGGHGVATLRITGDAQASVGAAFMLSYDALPAPARRLFRMLGDFPGPTVSTAAAAALTGDDEATCGALLDLLCAAHLVVEASPGRFALHDLLRSFARALPEEAPDERVAARRRVLGFYLAVTRAASRMVAPNTFRIPAGDDVPVVAMAFSDAIAATGWLDAELRNVAAIVIHAADAAEHGTARMSWLIADAVRGYLAGRRPAIEWLAIAGAGLMAARRYDDALGAAAMHLSLGNAHRWRSRFDTAKEHLHAAATLARTAGWRQAEASTASNLGIVHAELGETRAAADCFAQAIDVYRAIGQPASEAVARSNLAALRARLGDIPESNREATAALAFYRATGDRNGEALELVNIGINHTHLGDFDLGAGLLRRGLEIHTTFGDRYGMAIAHIGLAEHDHDTNRPTTALEHAQTALSLATEIGDLVNMANAHTVLTRIRDASQHSDLAMNHGKQALALAHRSRSAEPEIDALTALAELHAANARHDQAIPLAERAAALAHARGYVRLEGRAFHALAIAQLAAGHHAAAAEAARTALTRHRATGNRTDEARSHELLDRLQALSSTVR